MKNLLLFNYAIDTDDVKQISPDIYSFYIDYTKYYFIRIKRTKEEIEIIYKIVNEHLNRFHTIVKNRYDSITTEYDNSLFTLIKIRGPENDEIMLKDIVNESIDVTEINEKILYRNDWGSLWSQKMDYLEYQISELGKNHSIAIKSFSYYVGLAENAISYYNLLKIENSKLSLSQKRINCPNLSMNFYNPLNLIIDYRVRDIGEYLKSAFFNNYNIENELDWLIARNLLSPIEYNLLFVRLLYPSYYFDALNSVIEKDMSDDILLTYIEKVEEYELFLKKTYEKLSKKCTLMRIEWLIKKES